MRLTYTTYIKLFCTAADYHIHDLPALYLLTWRGKQPKYA